LPNTMISPAVPRWKKEKDDRRGKEEDKVCRDLRKNDKC